MDQARDSDGSFRQGPTQPIPRAVPIPSKGALECKGCCLASGHYAPHLHLRSHPDPCRLGSLPNSFRFLAVPPGFAPKWDHAIIPTPSSTNPSHPKKGHQKTNHRCSPTPNTLQRQLRATVQVGDAAEDLMEHLRHPIFAHHAVVIDPHGLRSSAVRPRKKEDVWKGPTDLF